MALEAVQRIDALFAIEREINGLSADERKAARQNQSVPLLASLEAWMRNERAKLSRHNHVAKAMDYILKRWDAFPASSRTDESAFQTTPPKGRSVVWL